VTDGDFWELYDAFRRVPNENKLITSFSLTASDLPKEGLKAICLWRPSASSPIELDQRRIVGMDHRGDDDKEGQREKVAQALSQIHPEFGEQAPSELILPDGSHQQVRSWRDLFLGVIGYWQQGKILTSQRCPIQSTRQRGRGRVIINTEAKHLNGEPFRSPRQVGPLWVETHASGRQLIANLRGVAQHLGVGLDNFSVLG
jgi:hypothetical protein